MTWQGALSRQPPPGVGYKYRDRLVCLWHGRGQIVLWRFCVAEVKSRSVASAWPRSGRALGLLLGRGQVVICGFCLAEVRSSSVASPASPVPCTVSSGSRGPTSSRPGVLLVFVLSGVCFSSVLRCSFLFLFQLSTAEVASLSVGHSAHLIVAAVSTATDSIDLFLGDGVCSSSLVMPFLARLLCSVFGCRFRVVLRLCSYFSVFGVSSGVSVD